VARSSEADALVALKNEVANYARAQRALDTARRRLERAMIRAVTAGDRVHERGGRATATRTKVAALVGVVPSRVTAIDGMPKGRNVTSVES
jgi:multidrug resistance efflux pump